jgi:superfamily I DNA/RNA helicase
MRSIPAVQSAAMSTHAAEPPLHPDRTTIDYLSVELTDGQRDVVYSDSQDHLLVVAPPGSGKTLTITRRIAHLLGEERRVDPEAVMALTFTERAANELVTRLASMVRPGVYAGTFHSACFRILREHATTAIGSSVPTVLSDADRLRMMRFAAGQAGFRFDDYGIKDLLNALSKMKCGNLPIDEAVAEYRFKPDVAETIFGVYQQEMRNENACDFDDLIVDTADLLWNDPEAAQRVHNRFRFIFVDEYQDVSAEQYRLIRALLPPEAEERQLLVVADANQAIFGFRGALPDKMLGQLYTDYQPARFELNENHRSIGRVVAIAQQLMLVAGAEEVSVSVRPEGSPVDWIERPDDIDEARLVAQLVERYIQQGRKPTEIAILYRRHRRAHLVEQALADRSIPVRRIERERFFDDRDVQETIRYFELVASTRDKSFASAINWPRFLVDELTMLDLRRIAARHDMTLGQLAESPELLRVDASPLTATIITRFMDDVVTPARASADDGAVAAVDRMLALMRSRRDPVPAAERANLRSTLDELGRHLSGSAEALDLALAAGRRIVVESDDHLDARLAAGLMSRVLGDYFPDERSGEAFVVACGETDRDADLRLNWIPDAQWTIAAQAWRFLQMVLMRRERLHQGDFTVFDLETTSNVPLTAEIMEIAAVRVSNGAVQDETFTARVRPSSPEAITQGAQNVHGISWEMVEHCPTIDQVLPAFLEFAGDGVVAGHNITSFDNRIVARECRTLELDPPTPFLLDTLLLSRRLHPRQSHRLDDLLTAEERASRGNHEALQDARLNANVLLRLLRDLNRDRAIGVLSEALPVVAASIMARQAEETPDNQLLVRVGARAFHLRPDWYLADGHDVPAAWLEQAGSWLDSSFSPEPDDEKWVNLENNWTGFVDGFARIRGEITLPELLERVSLATASDLDREERERVTMMTVYSAKGHEWPVVFMIGAENGEYPYSHPLDAGEELKEARRAFYVGLTRAQERLIISSAWRVNGDPREPSPFVNDIRHLVVHRPPKEKESDR